MGKLRAMLNAHIVIMAVLPIVLNMVVTPWIIISMVSLSKFVESPIYYLYVYGPTLWSGYHVVLTIMVYRFLKREGESLKDVVGPLRDKMWLSLSTILGLVGLSVLMFQIMEPMLTDVIYGSGFMRTFIMEYQRIPLASILYVVLVASFTAGVCEEIIWRGYLQTRLERKLGGRIWMAITIQALLFGLWHGISVHAVFTAMSGFIYGIIYAKTKRLVPIMISHWIGDVIGFSSMCLIST